MTVLAVYMAAKRWERHLRQLADRSAHPLRLYGMLELGMGSPRWRSSG